MSPCAPFMVPFTDLLLSVSFIDTLSSCATRGAEQLHESTLQFLWGKHGSKHTLLHLMLCGSPAHSCGKQPTVEENLHGI